MKAGVFMNNNEISYNDKHIINNDLEIMTPEIIANELMQNEEMIKKAMMIKAKRINSIVDNSKLEESLKMVQGIQNIGEILCKREVYENVLKSITCAKDLKFIADAQEKMISSLERLSDVSLMDSQGNKKRVNVAIQFNNTKIGVSVDE